MTLDTLSDDTLNLLYTGLIILGVVLPLAVIGFWQARAMQKEQQSGWKR